MNSITLTWTPEDGHGYSDFIITLDGTQRGGLHPGSEFDTGSSKTDEMITGLDSGTQYNVAVMSGTDEIWSGSIYTSKFLWKMLFLLNHQVSYSLTLLCEVLSQIKYEFFFSI